MTVKQIAKLAQTLTAQEYELLVTLRRVLPGSGSAAKPRRKYTRRAKKADKPAVVKAEPPKPGNGAPKRGPGRPRKAVRMIPVAPSEAQHSEA